LRRRVSNRVSITVILAGFLAISQVHADASITGKEWACGKAAKKAMARLVEGKNVVCQERARDSYKRSIAVCLAGGRDLGRELVASGLAVAYRRYSKRYAGEEDAARTAGLGMWAGKFTTPEIWRRINK
jgi:endonuclease YncB( thermonuclease family)